MRTTRRQLVATAAVLATMVVAGGCSPSPVNIGMMPVSGTWTMGVEVTACAPATGVVRVEADFHTVDTGWARLDVARVAPSDGPVRVTSWERDGRHWEWRTEEVQAGDCLHLRITAWCTSGERCPPATEYWFDYRISQVP